MTTIAFICVHNSCRSQIAEAITKARYGDLVQAHSAGTTAVEHINSDATRLLLTLTDIDMSMQYSKLISTLPPIDLVVTMGCNVNCPLLPCKHREDWGLDDPTGKDDNTFTQTINLISSKVDNLIERIKTNTL